MALFKRLNKKKLQKGASTARGMGTAGKVAQKQKLIKAGSRVGRIARTAGVVGAVVGGALLVERAAEKLGVRKGAGFIGKKPTSRKRKGKVPKTVKKWANRIVSRRKQEEKIVKDLFGTGGGKIIKKQPKKEGSISKAEALKALRD